MDAIDYQEPIPAEFKCKLPLMELTSWTPTNPCRRSLVFPNRYKTGVKKCKKFYWYDPELDNAWYGGICMECMDSLVHIKSKTLLLS
nr:zinc finger C2H2-type/integrase DNA-binding domain-containing protein [Tanacetum cinerariifolium]